MIDLDDFNAAFFNGDFDEVAVYTPTGGQARTIQVIFDNEYQAAQFSQADTAVESSGPRATCREADMAGVAHGDILQIRGKTWHLLEVRPDGTGIVTILLSEDPLP